MPTCLKCNGYFPSRLLINGKYRYLYKRKYCLNCSPFGEFNRRKLHLYNNIRTQKDSVEFICSDCKKTFLYFRTSGHSLNLCSTCRARSTRLKLKIKYLDYLGGKCTICGFDKSVHALEFHHRIPSEKSFQISGTIKSWDKVKPELDKCIILCANCHRQVEYGDLLV